VIVLESESAIGTSTSARNSEVVHSGKGWQELYGPLNALTAAFRLHVHPGTDNFCCEDLAIHQHIAIHLCLYTAGPELHLSGRDFVQEFIIHPTA